MYPLALTMVVTNIYIISPYVPNDSWQMHIPRYLDFILIAIFPHMYTVGKVDCRCFARCSVSFIKECSFPKSGILVVQKVQQQ
jgi:hypothetical protein